jgi:sugar phosphate isomerase/epimerase
MPTDINARDIRIGTIVGPHADGMRKILPHGFESFSIMFWQKLDGCDLKKLAAEVGQVLAGHDVKISTLSIFGNPLGVEAVDEETRRGWEACIDHALLFGCDLVTGFTGRTVGEPIEQCMPRFKEIFEPLAKRARDKGVRLAFENCASIWNMATIPHYWEMLFHTLPAENLGLEWEPCHQRVNLIDPMPQIRKYGRRFFHIHGKDATVRHDVIREYGINAPVPFAFHRTPGFGDGNWTDIISELRMIGFKGCIDIEGWHDPVYKEDLEMTGQVHALHYLKNCRGGAFVPNPV